MPCGLSFLVLRDFCLFSSFFVDLIAKTMSVWFVRLSLQNVLDASILKRCLASLGKGSLACLV